ncbi:putative agamous-like MADS-box protein AGL62-like [Capsicum annuum]|nr:putative agamous-like MADS-box protein AGL62-like [Capsicum annuum]
MSPGRLLAFAVRWSPIVVEPTILSGSDRCCLSDTVRMGLGRERVLGGGRPGTGEGEIEGEGVGLTCAGASTPAQVDLCHQPNDEEDEDDAYSPREVLLEKNKPTSSADSRRRCCSFRAVKVGSRQKVVVLVTLLVFLLMLVAAVLIWIGRGRNPIDSSVVARVYVDLFAVAVLLLGVALACYGLVLLLKMSKVRSDRAASDMWKVAGLAGVSVLCFTSSAAVAVFTDIPVCSSVPSAFVLWVMRELPPPLVTFGQQESRTIAFISDSSATVQPQRWTAAASVQNQVSRASPI